MKNLNQFNNEDDNKVNQSINREPQINKICVNF